MMRYPSLLALLLVTTPTVAAPPITIVRDTEKPGASKDGSYDRELQWTDAAGTNTARFSIKHKQSGDSRSATLAVDVGQRKVRDAVEPCPVDLALAFLPGSIGVTDVDADGIGELTFAYRSSCKGDVSPDTIKLLVLEGADKYILRGEDRIQVGENEWMGGAFKPDPAPAKWPKGAFEHAQALWKKLVK